MSKIGRKGGVLNSQSREIVYNVFRYFYNGTNSIAKYDAIHLVMESTKVSRSTVEIILTEATKSLKINNHPTFTSTKRSIKRKKPVSDLDSFDLDALRRLINNFHITNNSQVTIKKLMVEIENSEIGFKGSAKTLRMILRKIGFRWKKTQDNRKLLVEHNDCKIKRIKYLRKISEYRKSNRPIVYTDETYIHSNHTKPMSWVDTVNHEVGLKKPISKGSRLIVTHAGSKEGFVPDALLMFKSGLKSGDYHDEMNTVNYTKWIQDKLVPNLPKNAVIVMDNASYHHTLAKKLPTSSTNKQEMINWLQVRDIGYDPKATKTELYEIIQTRKETEKEFLVDSILEKNGHSVLRLPPYHPELNPIEKIWAQVKGKVSDNNTTFKMGDVIKLTEQAMKEITVENWEKVCAHVERQKNEYFIEENLHDNFIDNFIITDFTTDDSSLEESDFDDVNET